MNTLVGRLVEYMREVGEPMSIGQCVAGVRNSFHYLKKPDGTFYRGDVGKAVHGALWATGVFTKSAVSDVLVWPAASYALCDGSACE